MKYSVMQVMQHVQKYCLCNTLYKQALWGLFSNLITLYYVKIIWNMHKICYSHWQLYRSLYTTQYKSFFLPTPKVYDGSTTWTLVGQLKKTSQSHTVPFSVLAPLAPSKVSWNPLSGLSEFLLGMLIKAGTYTCKNVSADTSGRFKIWKRVF